MKRSGFTLVEIIVCLAVVAVLLTLTLVAVSAARKRGQYLAASGEIAQLAAKCEQYKGLHGRYPARLSLLDVDGVRRVNGEYVDPWGTPYGYFPRPIPSMPVDRNEPVSEYLVSVRMGNRTVSHTARTHPALNGFGSQDYLQWQQYIMALAINDIWSSSDARSVGFLIVSAGPDKVFAGGAPAAGLIGVPLEDDVVNYPRTDR